MQISATLVTDGSSDAVLKSILEWLFREHLPANTIVTLTIAALDRLPQPPRKNVDRFRTAWQLYPANVLFIHHDAENATYDARSTHTDKEMMEAFPQLPPYIKVIPVKMTEAWLLGDEAAIREAANNPWGSEPLDLPTKSRVETVDAKKVLFAALEKASGLSTRRLKSFNVHRQRHRLAELGLERNFGHLRGLESFDKLEAEMVQVIARF